MTDNVPNPDSPQSDNSEFTGWDDLLSRLDVEKNQAGESQTKQTAFEAVPIKAHLLHDLEKANCQVKWITGCEALSSYAAITFTSIAFISFDLMPLFKQWAVKNHAEDLHHICTLDHAIELNQILGLAIIFYISRLVFSGLFAIPRYVFCETAFLKKMKTLIEIPFRKLR